MWLVHLFGGKAACLSVAVSIYSEIEASSCWAPGNINTVVSEIGYTPEFFRELLQQKKGFLICTFLCIRAHWQCRFWIRVFAFMLHWRRMSQYENYPILQMLKNWFYKRWFCFETVVCMKKNGTLKLYWISCKIDTSLPASLLMKYPLLSLKASYKPFWQALLIGGLLQHGCKLNMPNETEFVFWFPFVHPTPFFVTHFTGSMWVTEPDLTYLFYI